MPSFKITAIGDGFVDFDANYGDGFNHNNQRVFVGQNIPPYTDAADLEAKLGAYVQMRVDEQKARAKAASTAKDAQTVTATVLPGV